MDRTDPGLYRRILRTAMQHTAGNLRAHFVTAFNGLAQGVQA